MTSSSEVSRRQAVGILGAGAAAVLAAPRFAAAQTTTAAAQADSAESDRLAAEFAAGAALVSAGLRMEIPEAADNPAAVPVRVWTTEPLSEDLWCEEIVVLAELNPEPLACRLRFTAEAGSADVAVRLRLIRSMDVRALARLSDGRVLEARRHVETTIGGCGM